jgi:hypothetical protein
MAEDEDVEDLGPCCACSGSGARNLMMLPWKAPMPGRGWGCVVCGLALDGALAVLCDPCVEIDAEILYACAGYPASDGRIPIGALEREGRHEHDETKHLEDA